MVIELLLWNRYFFSARQEEVTVVQMRVGICRKQEIIIQDTSILIDVSAKM